MLDIVIFREDQGGQPEKVRESQKRRFKDVSLVDKVIALDTRWRAGEQLILLFVSYFQGF